MAHAKEDENFGSEREEEVSATDKFMAMDEPSEGQCKAISRTRYYSGHGRAYREQDIRSTESTYCTNVDPFDPEHSFAVVVHAYNNQMHWYMYHRAKYVPDQGRIGAEPRMCQSHFPGKQPLSTPLLPFLGSLGSAT